MATHSSILAWTRGRGRLRGFLELRRPLGFSPEARRGSQGASRAAPGKSGLHARGEGERVMALESREGTRASRRAPSRARTLEAGERWARLAQAWGTGSSPSMADGVAQSGRSGSG